MGVPNQLCTIQNFITEFWTLRNFRNFGLPIQKQWQKTKKSITQLPSGGASSTSHYSKFYNRISDSLEFWKFHTQNQSVMPNNKKVNIAIA
jgi:hypothetical protein